MLSITPEQTEHALIQITKEMEKMRERDCKVKSQLADKQVITFYCNGYFPKQEDSDDDDDEADTDTYNNRYLLYERFVENKNNIDGLSLNNPDEIVLQLSEIDVYFNTPMSPGNAVMFRISANNKQGGFSRKELALKIMQRYHMLYFLFKNYDMEAGVIKSEPTKYDDFFEACFRPICYESQWTDNGLHSIIYNKDKDCWFFEELNSI
jgi:hypothetical protein